MLENVLRNLITIVLALVTATSANAAEGHVQGKAQTHIAQLAATVAPGDFAELKAELPAGITRFSQLLSGQRQDGSRAPPIDTWTDSAHWDAKRGRIFFQGLRKSNRFLSYVAATNTWNEISLDRENAPPLFEKFGHLYGRTALDWRRGHFYRLAGKTLHRYIIDEDRWERIEGGPLSGYISIEWHYGIDMLIGLNKGQLHGFRDGQWSHLGSSAVDGYHSSAKYNPKRNDMLFIGGNHSRRKVDLLTADGQIRHMKDAPFNYGISQDDLTHDPISGNYLVLHRDRRLWEYNPDRDEWRVARDFNDKKRHRAPFNRHDGIVPIPIDTLGVILWSQANGPQVYRHQSVFAPGMTGLPRPPEPAFPSSTTTGAQPKSHPKLDPAPKKPARATSPLKAQTTLNPSGDGLIQREARTMRPGEWRNLAHLTTWPGKDEGVSFKGFQTVSGLNGGSGSADGMGWTQNLVYHQGKLMMLLMRGQFERALLVMEADGHFWRVNQPQGFDRGGRRPFNRLTQDDRYMYFSPQAAKTSMGYMIRTPLENPGVFEPYGISIGDSQMDTTGNFAATYVPEWGRFYAYTPGGKVWSWARGDTEWTSHGKLPTDELGHRLTGYAGLLLWNPVRKELVIVGGQSFGKNPITHHKVYRLTEPLGAPEMLEDRRYPDSRLMPWGSGSSKLLVDPRDGSYIMLSRGAFYTSNSAGGTYKLYEDVSQSRPFGPYEPYIPFVIVPGTDVVAFISHIKGLVLYRLKPPLPENAHAPLSKPRPLPKATPNVPKAPKPHRQAENNTAPAEPPAKLMLEQDPTATERPQKIADRAAELTSTEIRRIRAESQR